MQKLKKDKLKEIPFIFIWFHFKLRSKYPYDLYLSFKQVKLVLTGAIHVPKNLLLCTLKQMEECGLIKRINQRKFKVINIDSEKELQRALNGGFWN